jgi:alpha-beta hydrolase superfamily lysophospholipase
VTSSSQSSWQPDLLGAGYQQQVLELGDDPDGEGAIGAVLVRREVRPAEAPERSVLYVHGFSDYFFQTELADFFAERGFAFYALDLRKSGRARRPGQTAHYVSDLLQYDAELDAALDIVVAEQPGRPVLVVAHSTGGLITALWLHRRRRLPTGAAPIAGLVLNSPWFDLQGKPINRSLLTWLLRPLAKLRPFREIKLPPGVYASTLHTDGTGEWTFNLEFKPMDGFPVTIGWLKAIRRGHAQLHRGLNVGVPSLVLRSDRTHYERRYSPASDRADTVLDVRQIARWAGCLGDETTVVPIPGARHDVFLSQQDAREAAYRRVDDWLHQHAMVANPTARGADAAASA